MLLWYCVQAYNKKTQFARDNVVRLGFEVLMPTEIRTRKYRGGVTHDKVVPVFGNYFFIRFDVDVDYWRPITSAYGVRRVFSYAPDRPTPVPQHAIDTLLDCVVDVKTHQIHPLSRVLVTNGPFTSYSGVVLDMPDEQRANVLIAIMGRDIEVEFDVESLELERAT